MDLESLWKVIVPLAFLAIWALTAIFNREGQSLPVRSKDQPNPYAPRPTARPAAPRPAEATVRPSPPIRWAPQATPARAAQSMGGDDDIVILDSPRQPSRPNPNRAPAPSKRAKAKPQAAPRHTPSIQPKAGFEGVAQNVNQQLTAPLAVQPLSEQAGPSSVQAVGQTSATRTGANALNARTLSIMAAMTDPARIREAMLINELLQPPLSLRKRGRGFGRQ